MIGNNGTVGGWTEQETNIIKEYYGKIHINDLVKMLPDRTVSSLWKKAKRLGIKAPVGKYTYNKEFFKTPNILNCYWAGFLAADGCINDRGMTHNVEVTLQARDKEHLVRFAKDAEYTGDVKDIVKCGFPCARLVVCCREWITDLEKNFNITPRKSLTLQPPNLTDVDLIKAYITGYIDGDGSIGIVKDKILTIQLRGTTMFLSWIKSYFDLWAYTDKHSAQVKISSGCGDYKVSANRAKSVAAELLSVNVPRMHRKWSKVHGN